MSDVQVMVVGLAVAFTGVCMMAPWMVVLGGGPARVAERLANVGFGLFFGGFVVTMAGILWHLWSRA